MDVQRPLELILARNLLSSLSTPPCSPTSEGTVVFYNEAAGKVLGRRFEESGPMTAEEWGEVHGPFDEDGERIPLRGARHAEADAQRPGGPRPLPHPLARRQGPHGSRPAALPIVAAGGQRGGMTFFWEAE